MTVDEDAAATSISSQLEVDDPDGGQTLEWTVSTAPSNGTLSGFPVTASSGSGVQPSGVTYEPNTDYSGSDAFDVQVADGNGGSATITVNVAVNNLAPVFNSTSTASFAENGTGTVLDVNADDGGDGANDDNVTYSLGGTDSDDFNLNASTGALSFSSAPDFENPTDSDGQNDYVVDVTADDGETSNNTTTQTITVNVTDVNEPPTVSLGSTSGSLNENNSPPNDVATVTISDDALGSNALSLSGADAGAFQIDGTDLEFTATADFEAKSSYDVTVEVDDSNVGSDPDDSQSFGLSITDTAPTIADQTVGAVDESATSGAGVGTVSSGGDDTSVSYAITANVNPDGDGTDAFAIDASTGEVTVADGGDLDFEQNPSLDVTVEVTDGTSPASATVTVDVNDVSEAPTIATNGGLTLDEAASSDITSNELEVTDMESGPADIIFTIDTDVQNGQIVNTATSTQLDQGDTFTQANVNADDIEYQHDGSETTSDAFDFTAEDAASETVSGTFSITINAVNDAPTISSIADQTIQEDGTLSSLSFTVDDAETSDLSTLSLSGSSGNTTLVPNSNISFTGPDAGGNATITVQPAANESGTATITVTVDDGAGANNTASEQFTLTVNAVPDLTITDGGPGNLDVTSDVSPGTNDNPVGIFALTAGQSGASFDAVTITNNAPNVEGISAARLYWSDDQTLEPGSDTQLDKVSTDASSAPGTIAFSGFTQSIPTSTRYAILAIDVQSGATADVSFELNGDGDLSTPGGEIATVNGTSQSSFSALPLSNGATALPVELATFEATLADGGSAAKTAGSKATVRLTWQTASETNNAGFEVQRRTARASSAGAPGTASAGWEKVGFVESKAEGGTTDEPTEYQFRDAVAFSADTLTYRLRQLDVGAGASFSEPVTIARRAVGQVRLLSTYPNPARGQATVRFAVPENVEAGGGMMQLYDALGRQVRAVRTTTEGGRHDRTLDTSSLSSGVYFLRLKVGNTVKTQRLTVVR